MQLKENVQIKRNSSSDISIIKKELLDKLYLINQFIKMGYDIAMRNKDREEQKFLASLRYQDVNELKAKYSHDLDML